MSDLPRARARQAKDPAARDPGAQEEERLARLRRLDAENPEGRWFLVLGSALRDLGHPLEALQVLRRGLSRDPDCLGGWVVLGQCYLALNEIASARRVFEGVLVRDRDNALALRGLAVIHAREGDRRRAANYYRELLKLVPRDFGAQRALADLLAASEHEAEKDEAALRLSERLAVGLEQGVARAPSEERSSEESASDKTASEETAGERLPEAGVRLLEEPVAEDEERGSTRRRRKPKARFGHPRTREPGTPHAMRATLKPERRPSPSLFEPPPADLDWGLTAGRPSEAVKGRRRPPSVPVPDRPRRGRHPGETSQEAEPRESGRRVSKRRDAGRRERTRQRGGHNPERNARAREEDAGKPRSNARSLSGYRRWLERMLEEEAGPGSGPRTREE